MSPEGRAAELRAQWSLGPLTPVAETPSSRIWRCDSPHGPAALKLLKPAGLEELQGATALHHWQGRAAARLLAHAPDAMLLEWLDGPTLGDRVRTASDGDTFPRLADFIRHLHAPSLLPKNPRGEAPQASGGRQPPSTPSTLPALGDLPDHFAPLLGSTDPGLAPARAARALLARPRPPVVLHGDLHHDNIIETPSGWRVIDPKGLWGDPGFEHANLFRNPVGRPGLALDPARIRALAKALTPEEPARPLAWALALTGLSRAWGGSAEGLAFNAALAEALGRALADVPNGAEWA
ncbi:aminoglycoside phosphotransferase family protein [Pseudoroseicyclus sp. CXY001]|uniref:aminoglycoside phosphotransferase family protein n=1 Tax=Pseudoroseicyclus sp. CXY001 TaxID=3242492 RepID=UPI003571618B